MPNVVNHAEVWSSELLEIMNQNALCSPFITTNVRWLDAKTFHFTSMSTSGFKNHDRNGGWNRGSFKQTDHPYTVEHDRDIEFLVDKADVDESNATASIKNIAEVFTETQSAPEKDALFFSKTATVAKGLAGYNSSTAASSWTKENVFGRLKAMLNSGKLRRYKNKGLIMYVQGFIMDLLEQSTEFVRNISIAQINDGGVGLETRVTDIDGVPVMEVIDNETFYSAFNFDGADGGFTPEKGAFKINVLLATPMTTKVVPKISSIYHFAPGTHTEGDGYLYQERELSDVFTFPNGKDGKIDSVYVDLDTVAVA